VRAFHRFSFVLRLAGIRLRRRLGRVALATLGIAAGAATLATVLGAGAVARDQSLARALERLPAEQRVVRGSWFGTAVDQAGFRELDNSVQTTFRGIGSRPIRAVQFRQTDIAGHGFNLAAADQLRRWIRLRSGRLPRVCGPARCEVVQVAGSGPIPRAPGLHLVRVGYADLVSRVPFLQLTSYGRTAEDILSFVSARKRPPFLVTGNVAGASSIPLLRPIFRSYAWVFPLGPKDVHPWSLDGLGRRIQRARATLTSQSFYFDVSDPISELAPAVAANRVTARRLLLVGGQAAALLLAFVVLVAAGGRSEAAATRARLARFGARRWQVVTLAVAEALAVGFVATLVGWAIGAAVGGLIADRAGVPVAGALVHSVVSATGVWSAVGLALAATAVLLLALHAPVVHVARFALTPLDLAAIGALGAIVLALARGSADANELAREGGTGALLFLLPALIAFVAAVAAVRLLGPIVRLLERAGRRSSVWSRLAALSLARDPGYAGAAAAFLLVSVGLAAFSLDYRSTLMRSQSDQARFATPADVVLKGTAGQRSSLADPRLAAVYSRGATRSVPVLRLDGQVGSGPSSRAISVLGLPAGAIAKPPFWRSDFASSSPRTLADAVDVGNARPRGVRIPRDAVQLRLRVRQRGFPLRIVASIETRAGPFQSFELSHEPPVLVGHIPRAARGGLLVGFGFSPSQAEAHNARPAAGTLVVGPLSARGPSGRHVLERSFADWIGTGGIRASGRRLDYFVTNANDAVFRPRQRTDETRLPVIVTPGLAASAGTGGLLPIRVGDQALVVRVAAVAHRFPTLYGSFVVADEQALATALNAEAPGSAVTNEAWLDGVPARSERALEAAVGRPPLQDVRATSQRKVEASLRDDPLARAVLWTLAGLALVGFALALGGLAVAVTADLRDERGELFDLEAQGARPSAIRRHVRLRSGGVLALGVIGGIALAAVLSVLVVAVVLVTANGRLPEPPLLLSIDWPLVLGALAAYLVCAWGLVALTTRSAVR
jgi:hypothetical protein